MPTQQADSKKGKIERELLTLNLMLLQEGVDKEYVLVEKSKSVDAKGLKL